MIFVLFELACERKRLGTSIIHIVLEIGRRALMQPALKSQYLLEYLLDLLMLAWTQDVFCILLESIEFTF